MRQIDADALKKQIEDFHCKNCDNYNFVRCRACGIDNTISYLEEAPTVSGWISVEDRLTPELRHVIDEGDEWDISDRVLVKVYKGDVTIGKYEKDDVNSGWTDDYGAWLTVTHWMPIPE